MSGIGRGAERPDAPVRRAAQARKRRGGPLPFETFVERRIREALEQGLFDDLPGRGQPLDLGEENPFEDPDWRVAYRILKNAGFAPRWIELGRELEADWQVCLERVVAHERRVRVEVALLRRYVAPAAGDLAALQDAHARLVGEVVERVRAYNEKMLIYNLTVPIFSLQRQRQRVEPLLERLAALEPARLYAAG